MLLQQMKTDITKSLTTLGQRFNSIDGALKAEYDLRLQDNNDMLVAFKWMEDRLAAVEKEAHDKSMEDWMSMMGEAPPLRLRGGAGSPPGSSLMGPPPWAPPVRQPPIQPSPQQGQLAIQHPPMREI